MPEWWTYELSDFLLFSPRTYYRLLERYNEAVWPGQLLALGLGLALLGLLRGSGAWQGRVICAILAGLWGWVAGAFVWARYTTINWAAVYLLPLFGIEILLLLAGGVIRQRLKLRVTRDKRSMLGIAIFSFALVGYPAIAALVGRDWRQAEVFGIAPDPTVLGTLGVLTLAEGPLRRWLLVVPVLWCVLSGLTLWAMESPEAWLPPGLALLSLIGGAGNTGNDVGRR
jgi:hypothetical protein